MLITADSHRLPHEHALAVLLEGRGPGICVPRLSQSSATRWQEHPEFGKRSGGGGRENPRGRRPRQFQARLGSDLVTISGDAEEPREEACTPRVACLLRGMDEAYRI